MKKIGMLFGVGIAILLLTAACNAPPPAEIEGPTRTITVDDREIVVPANPERVVALDVGTAVDLIALGIEPVGIVDYGQRDTIAFLAYDHSEIPSLGNSDGPNYEAILEMNPDVIVGTLERISWFSDAEGQLAAIAPIALSDASTAGWDEHLLFVGEVVNRQDEAQTIVDTFEIRLTEFREAYEASGKDETIAIIRSRAGSFNIYANNYFCSELVKAAGIKMPEGYADLPQRNSLSLEEIDTLSSDHLFVVARNEDESGALVDAKNGPLWQFLPAVEKDQVYEVEFSVWVSGWNSAGANMVLDDLYELVLQEPAQTPNPLAYLILDEY